MKKYIHQSWCVVWLSVGIIGGVILGLVLRINFLASAWFLVVVGILFVISMLRPLMIMMVLALAAGFLLSFWRVTNVLFEMETNGETWTTSVEAEKDGVDGMVLSARDWFAERIAGLIPEPEVKLGLSYLLGMKSGLPKELSENLRVVGLTHIVVASGAHLSILVEVARKIFGKVSRFAGVFGAIGFILFFMCMVGWTPSIMRAGIMAILTLITWYVGRKIAPLRMILMVMAGTLLIDPTFIINLGWMLSFASYAGIMLLGPRLNKFFYGEKKPGFIASTVLTTLAATLMTLPITLFYFGQVSLISVVANLLILPTLSVAMGLTFLTGVVAGLPFIEIVVSSMAIWLLDFHIGVVEFFGGMEQFLVKIEPYNPWVFLIYVAVLAPMIGGLMMRWIYKKNMVKLNHEE
jgi:ComEC/Rec2-related protein